MLLRHGAPTAGVLGERTQIALHVPLGVLTFVASIYGLL